MKRHISKLNISKWKESADALWIHGTDLLLIEDRSDTEEEKAAFLSAVKELHTSFAGSIFVKGTIRRFEDVKKYLYAGCERVIFEETQKESEAYTESRARFSEEHLAFATADGLRLPETGEEITIEEEIREGNPLCSSLSFSELKCGADGLIPVITVDEESGDVLMLAYMNEEAFNETLKSGLMTYYSRSRKELWKKGETSGNYQFLTSLTADCDRDTLLARVRPKGPACHTGKPNCFFETLTDRSAKGKEKEDVLEAVYAIIRDRKEHPKEGSYTNYLFEKGIDKILKKVGEENTEILIAAKNPDPSEIRYEIADYLYHLMVLMAECGVDWDEVKDELARR